MRISRSLLGLALLLVPALAAGQDVSDDTLVTPPSFTPSGVGLPTPRRTILFPAPTLAAPLPFALSRPLVLPSWFASHHRVSLPLPHQPELLPRLTLPSLHASLAGDRASAPAPERIAAVGTPPSLAPAPALLPPPLAFLSPRRSRASLADTTDTTDTTGHAAPSPPAQRDILGDQGTLSLNVQSRIETKVERDRNERCVATDLLSPFGSCFSPFQPQFGFQFGVQSNGTIGDRVHVNVDYDSQREFDASNTISAYYQGKPNEILQRVDVGNVSFTPPPSRFITAGIPSGNYGVQAMGKLGAMDFRAIAAQQRGNIVRDRVFTVGDSTVQAVDREIADYQLERRRFFWVIDPRAAFPSRFPNIDILDPALASLAAQLPPGQRPRRVLVYRYRTPAPGGSVARDINGPFAVTRFARNTNVIGPYEVMRQGIDYYIDPSNLWIVLVNPLSDDERLAVSYTVTGPDGREAIVPSVGGTFPTARRAAGRDTVNLLWDNQVLPGDSAFDREIRSAYRIGGEEVERASVTARIVTGANADQERPVAGPAGTYLQLFGLAQRTNTSRFDVQNRLWPRVADPNQALTATGASGGVPARLIHDDFIILPSLAPFADSGLVHPPNPVNDSLYRTTDADLVSARRPPTQYRLRVTYAASGSGFAGALLLGSVQVRPGSERIFLGGRQLVRGVDYTVDYELGQVTFTHPDVLFVRPEQVSVQFEENPLFASAPTSIFGLVARLPTARGDVAFTALSQSQQSAFNRPPLGFEPTSTTLAGITGNFTWPSALLSRLVSKLPAAQHGAPATVNIQGEVATSRPQTNTARSAFLETFEGDAGIDVDLLETAWRYGSEPAIRGGGLQLGNSTYDFAIDSAATMAWQNIGTVLDPATRSGSTIQFFPQQIDSQFVFVGGQSFSAPETVLWLDLFPSGVGRLPLALEQSHWSYPGGGGRPWRSISQSLSPNGLDLSNVQHVEFWALIDTTQLARPADPVLVFDFGEISENSVFFAPDSLTVRLDNTTGQIDSTYSGRKLQGADRLDTERDSITRTFDVARDDHGLPGDVADTLQVVDLVSRHTGAIFDFPTCNRGPTPALPLGDATANCTIGNRQLDENDLDRDGFINIKSAARNSEQILRYVVNLGDPASYAKVGRCYRSATDTSSTTPGARPVCWVRFDVPFGAPTESLNNPIPRRIKSLRLTVVGGAGNPRGRFTQLAIARLRLTGSPWTRRTDAAIAGIGGTHVDAAGTVITGAIGTQDRDAQGGLVYQPPPGVTDQPDSKGSAFSPGTIQVNEQSLRLVAVDVPLHHRAEAFFRFPEGEKNFMAYHELRVWARGRGKGWGTDGDLQFYVKVGRDADNFYLFRTPVNQGTTAAAWLPEVTVDFHRFIALRAALENAFLHGGDTLQCTGIDSALVVSSELAPTPGNKRFAACDDGYIVYTSNPAVSAPNLAAVQELAVGMVRVSSAGLGIGGPITPTDSLELWVDDIRLSGAVNDPGYAGQLGINILAGDLGTLSVNASRRDGNFRQLGEQPSFIADNELDVASTVRLDKFLPRSLGLALPFTVSHTTTRGDPLFVANSDLDAAAIAGVRAPRTSSTAYALSIRRATPLEHSALAPLVNNVSLTASYATAASRSDFQTGASSAFAGGVDYDLAAAPRTTRTPGFLRRLIDHLPHWLRNTQLLRGVHDGTIRWNPSDVRFTSSYARTSDARESFLLPVAFTGDSGSRVSGLENTWRNTGAVELRPFAALSARVEISSLRDLRDYGDSSPVSIIARAERERFLGLDMGLEREREVTSLVSFAPPVSPWITPRIDYSSSFSILRDPNVTTLVRSGDSTGALVLPRRLYNTQGLGISTTVDLPRAATLYTRDSTTLRRLLTAFSPVDIQWRRDLRSSFDGAPFDPSFGYQLAFGGTNAFRDVAGVLATSAGVSHDFVVSHSLALPLGLTLFDRYTRVSGTSWSRAVDVQTVLEARSETFPDLNLRWSYAPPKFLRDVITSVAAQVGARYTHGRTDQPDLGAAFLPGIDLPTSQTITQYPINGALSWSLLGGFSTSGGWNHTAHQDVRSDGLTEGTQNDVNVDVGKTFSLPESWNIKSKQLRTHLSYQSSRTRTVFVGDSADLRVADNGRWSVTANADSDVSDSMTLSFLLSRILTYDNIFDRRFSQTVLSVIFHLQFAGNTVR